MTRIQSSVGLITGIPIEETVKKLMEVAAQPRDVLADRTKLLEAESLALDKLSSLVLALRFDANKLGSTSLYNSRSATSNNTAALTATASTTTPPAKGTYLFTPVQTASAQQLLSQSFAADANVGAGSFTIRPGGFVDKGISLDELNSGAGFQRGEIRITDRSGASSVIDLRFARTVDDVLTAINDNTTINVTATAVGDQFRLTDNTSQTASNLIVQEVSGGTTATSLGLDGISVAANTATGSDVFALHAGTRLSLLNDGNGVQQRTGNDLAITLRDGTTLDVDLDGATTLGDALEAINAANPAKLSATIAADGNRIQLNDLTAGGGTFAVANVGSGTAAKDLGLTVAASGGTISGRRLVAGLQDTLVSSLHGGQGLGTLGEVDVTNRDNVSFTVDLDGAETLGEIIDAFNAQSTEVTASVNAARNGIVLADVTGGSASNFIVADGDANDTATALGIVVNQTGTSANSGTLDRQTVSEATLLSSLNRGAGVTLGDLRITDSSGQVAIVDLNPTDNEATTIGDVIDAINTASVDVLARINETGDGILLVDTADGSGTLAVAEVGSGRIAADLGILGSAVEAQIDGEEEQVIDGTSTTTVTIAADDNLADLVTKINDLDAGVTASLVNDGLGQRLSIVSDATGSANELLVDTTDSSLNLQQISDARDAVLLYGTAANVGSGILVSSSSNTFSNVVQGLNLTVVAGSTDPVTVTVAASNTSLTTAVEDFVEAFNSIKKNIDEVADFDPEALTTGVLFGTSAVLRVEADLNRLFSGRFFGVGAYQSLAAVGIDFNDAGEMVLNKAELQSAFEKDPESVEQLFADEDVGLVAKLEGIVDRLAVDENSALGSRGSSLADKIEANNARIATMNETLEREQDRLFAQFFQLESIIAGLQQSLDALANFTPVPPLARSSQ
jgi:flagellar hook-associated protein 2